MRFIQSKFFGYLVLILFAFFMYWSFFPMKNIEQKLIKATGNPEMLDLKPSSTTDEIYRYVDRIGEPGIEVLTEMYTYQDCVYPFAYGAFFLSAFLFFISRVAPQNKKLLSLAGLPLLMMMADGIENFSILQILLHPTTKITPAYYLGMITTTKWILGAVSILLLLIFMLLFIYQKLVKRKMPNK